MTVRLGDFDRPVPAAPPAGDQVFRHWTGVPAHGAGTGALHRPIVRLR